MGTDRIDLNTMHSTEHMTGICVGDTPTIALHCSGGDRNQWRKLRDTVGAGFAVWAPDLIGHGSSGHWAGDHAFTLEDEALPLVDLVDAIDGPVHLVGHSYGGMVALKIACARPDRVASISLYEPSAFSLLGQIGAHAELAEIESLARAVSWGVLSGAYAQTACTFVDYWNGRGTWGALQPTARDAVLAWLPKAPLEFRALIVDETLAHDTPLSCPVLIMRGEHALAPSRRIVEALALRLANSRIEVVSGAGHMGPFTHGGAVAERIARHIRRVTGDRIVQSALAA